MDSGLDRAFLALLVVAALAFIGCSDDATSSEPDPATTDAAGDDGAPVAESALTWHETIAPIVAAHCGGCHIEGGAAPFALDTHTAWETFGAASMAAIDDGRMPPWQPDPSCREFENERILPPGDRTLLDAWADSGFPAGDATNAAALPEPPEPFEPTHEAGLPSAYTPALGNPDDYRCFILDLAFDEPAYLTGTNVVPGTSAVHHVLVFALTDRQAEEAYMRDAEDPELGYTCFGGPVALNIGGQETGGITGDAIASRLAEFGGVPNQIAAWVPGYAPFTAPDDVAVRIDEGAVVVMQVHYSAVGGAAAPDRDTTVQLVLTDEEPEFLSYTRPLAILELDIPAGEADALHTASFPYYGDAPLRIRGLTGHMHLLGSEIRVDVARQDGTEACGLYIPEWDFNWQQAYKIADGETLDVYDGDAVELLCSFDNSAANQPVFNGEQIATRDVEWGDGTLDEMCLVYLETITPFEPPRAGPACSPTCAETCPADDFACLLRCGGRDLDCFGCAFAGLVDCGGQLCAVGLLQAQECFEGCAKASAMLDSDLTACLEDRCPDALTGLVDCAAPLYGTEACQPAMAECGL